MCSARRCCRIGMISAGVGLSPGTWMPMRLQRALSGAISVFIFVQFIGVLSAADRRRISAMAERGAVTREGLKVEGFQVIKKPATCFRWLEVWVPFEEGSLNC